MESSTTSGDVSGEVHHRLANTYQTIQSLISSRIRRTHDEGARRELSGVLQAVTALGRMQKHLADGRGEVDFGAYLIDTAEEWRADAHGRRIDVVLDVDGVRLPERTASALALIADELVSNSFQHAFAQSGPGRVDVTLRQVDGHAVFSVADSGCGMGDGQPGGGITLAQSLARQVGGGLALRDGQGLMASVGFDVR